MNETSSKCILKLKNIRKEYENFVLDNVNFELKEGSITGFIGCNGAGKSTTLNLIMNLIKPTSGEIYYYDKLINDNSIFDIGYMGETQGIYPDLKLKELSKFVKRTYKDNWNNERYDLFINKIFKLDENRKIKELSTGMRMKYFISLTLAHNPKLLILDEPTTGLDPSARIEFLDILKDINKKCNTTIIISSHIIEDVERIADDVIFIHKGKIIIKEKKESLMKDYFKINLEDMDKSDEELVKKKGIKFDKCYVIKSSYIKNLDKDKYESLSITDFFKVVKSEEFDYDIAN